jgi:hypothetical protein
MSTPPPSPGLATGGNRPHGHKQSDRHNARHPNRPEGSRHGSDWLSRLHRRHDAKHHAPSHQDEEQAPLLAQADDHEEDHAQGPEEAGSYPGTYSQLHLLKPARDCLLAIKTSLLRCASHASNGAMKTGRGAKKGSKAVGKAMSKGARNSSQAIKKNPKRTLSAFIIFLLLANIATGITFGLHLLIDAMLKTSNNPSSIRAADNMLRNLRPVADVKGASNLFVTTETKNVDPCTAFDEFVCGGFDKHHNFRSEQSHVDTGKQ